MTNEDLSEIVLEVKSDVKLALQKIEDQILPLITDHHRVLYGDSKKMGEGGVISKIRDIISEMDTMKKITYGIIGVVISGMGVFITQLIMKIVK